MMWMSILCPKCGERSEVNLNEMEERVQCKYCLETIEVASPICPQEEDVSGELFAMSGSSDSYGLDSSFWLS
jgi:phage terminase large subunit GpA-like protein